MSINVIREFERIQKKICRHKMSIMFNEICIYVYMYVYICMYTYVYMCIYIHRYIWRGSWCNGYRRRKWARQHEFKSWTRLITFHRALIPLGKV